MKELARPVADAIKMNRVHYRPDRFANTSLDWMENIRDWCISRQLWWGHRIPVYYGPNGEVKVSVEPITDDGWHQDEDVLDTWFSSALWPFAVLGWPDKLETEFYPTSVLITGRDILNLWVSRMILTSLYFVDDEIPFHDVLVHPTVQDVFGLRMSKSLGTGIDPMGLIEVYGADATRFGLLQLVTGAQDVRFIDQAEVALGEDTVRRCLREKKPLPLEWTGKPAERYPQMQSARNFANKIWNAARFVLTNAENIGTVEPFDIQTAELDMAGTWILERLSITISTVTTSLNDYQFDTAASTLYSFIWNDFCDWFVEVSKPKLRAGDTAQIALLTHVLEVTMRLLHPFMPFISEEIWQRLPKPVAADSLCIAQWPAPAHAYGLMTDASAEAFAAQQKLFGTFDENESRLGFALVQETVSRVRNLRAEAKLPPSQKLKVTLVALSQEASDVLSEGVPYLLQLGNLEAIDVVAADAPRPQNAVSTALPEVEVFLPLEGLIDVERETVRLQKELESLNKDLAIVEKKLSNAQFVDKAPPAVVEKEQGKRAELQNSIQKLSTRLREMES
jgi:valyl-tRNA synthetase